VIRGSQFDGLAGHRPGRRQDIAEPVDQLGHRELVALDAGALVIDERHLDEHALRPSLARRQMRLE